MLQYGKNIKINHSRQKVGSKEIHFYKNQNLSDKLYDKGGSGKKVMRKDEDESS